MRRSLRLGWPVRPELVALAGIILLGAALRLVGIGYGLPVLLYNDELNLVRNATHISWQDLNPHLFVHGSLQFYVVKLVTAAAGAVAPLFSGKPSDDFLVTRLLSTAFNLATLPLVFGLGRQLSGRVAGLVGALLFALSPAMVEISHYASDEAMVTFWSTLSIAGMVIWLAGDQRGRLLAAVAAGLASATKYNAVLLVVPLALIAVAGARKQESSLDRRRLVLFLSTISCAAAGWLAVFVLQDPILRLGTAWTNSGVLQPVYYQVFDRLLAFGLVVVLAGWLLALAALWSRRAGTFLGRKAVSAINLMTSDTLWLPLLIAAGTYLVVSPYDVLDFPAFAQGFFFDLAHQSQASLVGFPPGSRSYAAAAADAIRLDYLFYLRGLLLDWGIPAIAGMVLGLWHLWRSARLALLPVALLPILLILLATLGRNYGVRYLYPIWGLLALLAAIGCAALLAAIRARLQPAWLYGAAALLLVLAVCWSSLVEVVQLLEHHFLRPDTRPMAYDWIALNLPDGANILREGESTTMVDTPELERLTNRFNTNVELFPFEKNSLAQWRAQGIQFVVMSDSRRRFYTAHSAQFTDVLAEYRRLETQGRLLHAVEPDAAVQGPPIYIYALP